VIWRRTLGTNTDFWVLLATARSSLDGPMLYVSGSTPPIASPISTCRSARSASSVRRVRDLLVLGTIDLWLIAPRDHHRLYGRLAVSSLVGRGSRAIGRSRPTRSHHRTADRAMRDLRTRPAPFLILIPSSAGPRLLARAHDAPSHRRRALAQSQRWSSSVFHVI